MAGIMSRTAIGRIAAASAFLVVICLSGAGCATTPSFPQPISVRAQGQDCVLGFDTDGDHVVDYRQYQHVDGRKYALEYGAEAGAGRRVELERIDVDECPHFIIVLDGTPFELVEELYREGYFRFFYPPSKVICCYPAMTDLALTRLFHAGRCRAYQARYFDRAANAYSEAYAVYLSGENSPWLEHMDYRCSMWRDASAYLDPRGLFEHELKGMLKVFKQAETGRVAAYSVATAGLGTRGGREAILRYLITIDRLCEQLIFEREGRVNITLVADHGHNLTPNKCVSFRETLEAGGFRQSKSLRSPRDVAPVGYGLVTYAAFFTDAPAEVADCLLKHPAVEMAFFPDEDGVVVLDRCGAAHIGKTADGFMYEYDEADPLRLRAIIEDLEHAGKLGPGGAIDEETLFAATAEHVYPDPLRRVWEAFFELVESPPDLIVNLRDGSCYGSRLFEFMIGDAASTHGSLNRISSTTFALTTLGELPPIMRSEDVTPALEEALEKRR